VLTNDEDIKERWKEYFNKLMNVENDWNGVIDFVSGNIGLVREISVDEVKRATQAMKNGNAVGPDGIPVEVWKVLKGYGWTWLTLFFKSCYTRRRSRTSGVTAHLIPFLNTG
jgi:hypothetical protein